MTQLQRRLGARDYAVAAMMNLMWGLNVIAVKQAVGEVQPLTAAFLRQVMVAAICLPWLRIVPGEMRRLLPLGVLSGGMFYLFINYAVQASTNLSALSIAGQLGVPFAMILAVIVFGERIHRFRILGVALSMLGVAILLIDPNGAAELPGLALQTVASAIWAGASLIQRQLKAVPILTIYAWIGMIGALFLAPVAWLAEPQGMRALPHVPLTGIGWVAFSAIGSTLLGHGSMSWLLQRHPVASVAPLTLASPIVSVICASLFFHTPLTPVMILGGAIALVGVAIVTIRWAKVEEGGA